MGNIGDFHLQHNDNTSTSGHTTPGDGSNADYSSNQDVSSGASLSASSALDNGSMDDSDGDFPDVEHESVGRHVAFKRGKTAHTTTTLFVLDQEHLIDIKSTD